MPEEKKHNVALQHKTVHSREHDYMFSDSTKMLFFFFLSVMFLNMCHLSPQQAFHVFLKIEL